MKHSSRNFLFAYLVLVALPVFGLVGILRHGRNMTAPVAVGGIWKLQVDAARLSSFPCGSLLSVANLAFTISQSGKRFTLNFANSPLASSSGTVEATTIQADILPTTTGKDSGCSGHALSLNAKINGASTPPSLTGTLQASDCASCSPVEFNAVREDQAKAKGAH
jgi:hypothetical protein